MGIDLDALIRTIGYPGLFLIIFAETGLLIGFFLPGDTALVAAGVAASSGKLEIWWLIPLLIAAAILGDSTGYLIGKHVGPRLFTRDESRFFRRSHLLRAKQFYERHGGKTIVIARWVGYLRTFAPTVAGAVEMDQRRFLAFNIVGGASWVISLTLAGYAFGSAVSNIEQYMVLFFGGAFVLSVSPALFAFIRRRRAIARSRLRNEGEPIS